MNLQNPNHSLDYRDAIRGANVLGNAQSKCTVAADPRVTALFVSAFFDELIAGGVRFVVISPGSRSTPLAVMAYEAEQRGIGGIRVIVDVDERGAAFLALGLGKATGHPACVICTSGTAVANLYPAVMEAEASRVPLILLTGDRPLRLQGLGAPQTCDQLHAFGSHVAAFRQMPLPAQDDVSLAFARQAAREALVAAGGESACDTILTFEKASVSESNATYKDSIHLDIVVDIENDTVDNKMPISPRVDMRFSRAPGAPVHVNFPFEEPLLPDCHTEGLFVCGRSCTYSDAHIHHEKCSFEHMAQFQGAHEDNKIHLSLLPMIVRPRASATDLAGHLDMLVRVLSRFRTLILAGEGTIETEADARLLLAWANRYHIPLLADPLSGLRSFVSDMVIDHYDNICARPTWPQPDLMIRFGRWPISKRATQAFATLGLLEVVVDERETRDFNAMTTTFVQCAPPDFVRFLVDMMDSGEHDYVVSEMQCEFADAWCVANQAASERIASVDRETKCCEGTVVRTVLDTAPEDSYIVAANSMTIRAFDTFYTKQNKRLRLLCNRGLNGIDGIVSTAVGVACASGVATLITGDLSLLHDVNALALNRELQNMRIIATTTDAANITHRMHTTGKKGCSSDQPHLVIVIFDNNGGAIFDMLPQQSDKPFFERLFLTPQDVCFEKVAQAFALPHRIVTTVQDFREAYMQALNVPGISLITVPVPLRGVKERYGRYW